MAKQNIDLKFKHRGTRKCRICGNVRGLIQKYGLYICRKCFRENAEKLGFRKFG
ncbi:MAG: 30S ribosomal protein S14 [Candidatus Micrarchaeota archaeon]